jgi:hypothetical protein
VVSELNYEFELHLHHLPHVSIKYLMCWTFLINKVFKTTREGQHGAKEGRYSNSSDNIVRSRKQHNFL